MWCAPSSFLIPNWYTHGFCLCRKQELCRTRTEGWRFFRVSPLSFSFVCFCRLPWARYLSFVLYVSLSFVFAENYSSKWWWGLEIGGVAPLQSLAIPSRHSPLQGYPPTLNTHNTLIFKTKGQTWIGDYTLPKTQLIQELSAFAKETTWTTTTTTNNEQVHSVGGVTKKFHFFINFLLADVKL